MAREIREFAVTVPHGTAKATPQVTDVASGTRILRRLEVKVPDGPRGQMGFQIGMATRQLIPYGVGQFIVTNDVELGWDLEDQPSSGAWQVIAYNTGLFDHTLYVRFLFDLPGQDQVVAPTLLDSAALSSSGAGVGSGLPAPALPPVPLPAPIPLPLPELPPAIAPPLPMLPPPPVLPALPGQVLAGNYSGPAAWPLSNQDLTGIEL